MLRVKSNFSSKSILFYLFFGIFPILPDYFRVAGFPVYVVVLLIVFLFYLADFVKRGFRIKKRGYSVLISIYTITVVIQFLLSLDFSNVLVYFLKCVAPIIITIKFASSKDRIDEIIDALISFSIPIMVFGIVEFLLKFNIFSLIENTEMGLMGTVPQVRLSFCRSEGPFGQSIPFAIYITFICMFTQYRLYTSDRSHRNRYYAAIILCFISEITTLSRAPMLVFFALNLACLLYYNPQKQIGFIIKALIGVGIIALILEAVGVPIGEYAKNLYMMFYSLTQSNVSSSFASTFGDNADPFEYRFALQGRVFKHMAEQNISFWFGDYGWSNYFSIDNGYLAFIMFHGVVGCTGRCLLYVGSLYQMIKSYLKKHIDKKEKSFFYFFSLCIAGYLMNLLSVAQMGELPILLITIGLSLAEAYYQRKNLVI